MIKQLVFDVCTGCNFYVTQLFPLVITSPLHNHKQDVGNIGVWDQFLSI